MQLKQFIRPRVSVWMAVIRMFGSPTASQTMPLPSLFLSISEKRMSYLSICELLKSFYCIKYAMLNGSSHMSRIPPVQHSFQQPFRFLKSQCFREYASYIAKCSKCYTTSTINTFHSRKPTVSNQFMTAHR